MGGKEEDFKGKMESSSNSGKKRVFGPGGRDLRLFAYIDEFVCEYCPEKVQFDRFIHATRHYRDVHMERAYLKCPKCDKKTYTSGEFVTHVETHNDPDRCKCTICGKMTLSKVALKKHMRCHQLDLEENNPFPCRLCSRRFEAEYKRDKHELLHRPKPIIPKQYGRDEAMLEFYQRIYCDLCEEVKPDSTSFDNFWDLKVHMNKQHEKAPYLKCPICSKKMGVRHQIMMHIDVHKNPELYRCEVCNEIHQYLDRHMISAHTPSTAAPEKKRYNCEQCGKVFKFRWKLKYHINEAHGVKDVSCDICKKFFTRPALAAHKRKAHIEGEASFLCDHCPKLFNKQQTLRMHIAVAHENRRKHKKCNLCGKEVTGMTKHMQMVHPSEGPVSCDLCGKNFRSPFHMKRHRLNTCEVTMNDRPYKCEVCGKGFSLKLTMTEHMTTHTRTNLYQCAFCLKTYGYLSNLQKHRKKAHPQEWREVKGDQSIVTVIPLSAPVVAPVTEYEIPIAGQ
ncbi:zinc finger protein 616-like [Anopheles ziemanni]|nr:zinc finger protein 616-like [Anopheles ziemanni]